MLTFLKWLGITILVIAVAIGVFLFGMRFHDGPLAIVSGGPFTSGELTEPPADWSFLEGRDEMEFQTMSPATSRVVWLVVHDERLYLISGYMTTGFGKIWKQWPHYMEQDNRVILRIDGKLYEQQLVRMMDHPELAEILTKFGNKYGFNAPGDPTEMVRSGYAWFYEVQDRS